MKILQICHKPPFPAKDGGCLAMSNISRGLIDAGHELKILTVETHKHPFEPEKISDELLTKSSMQAVLVDTKLNLIDAFSNLVTSDSYNISRFFTPDFDIALIRILQKEKFDIIHLESLFMTPYIATIRRYTKGRIVLRSHNLEYVIWERLAKSTRSKAKKAYLALLAKQLKKYEVNVMNQVDGIAAITNEDAEKYNKLGNQKPMITIPFGLNLDDYKIDQSDLEFPTLFHLGSMDWKPNLEGVEWFLKKVWPTIHKSFPHLTLYLAGRNMPQSFEKLQHPKIKVVGEVESARKFMNSKAIMLVPLLSAGGMRVKIIEGMALGKPIISTKIGAEGIDYNPGENIMIANTPGEFKKAIGHLLNKTEFDKTGTNARRLIEQEYDNTLITKKLVTFYKMLALE